MAESYASRIASWLKLNPSESDELWSRISRFHDDGHFAEAYSAFQDALGKYPSLLDSGDMRVFLAELELLANSNHRKALRLLNRAEQSGFMEEARYYYVRGAAKWASGQYEDSIRDTERCVALEPLLVHLISLAESLSFVDGTRATDAWHRVLESDPSNCLAHVCLGHEAAKAGDCAKALLLARKAEGLKPTVTEVFEIGRLYHELAPYRRAIAAYVRANDSGYENKATLLACLAACYISLGKPEEARVYAGQALCHDPDDEYARGVWQQCDNA